MAWRGKKGGGRKEPQFGLGAALSELRLTADDRIPRAEEERPKKLSSKRAMIDDEDDEDAPLERKPRASRPSRKRKASGKANAKARGGLERSIYGDRSERPRDGQG